MTTNTYKLRGLKVIGQFSGITNKVYKTKGACKGAETRSSNKTYADKLAQLQNKFNH